MQAVERLSSYITQGVYTVSGPFHPFGGAVDIIVVEQQDGSFKSSPWYVRFGKFLGVLKTREMVVKIFVNGNEAGFHMYLDHKGEAFFLKEYDSDGEGVGLSPSSSGDETDEGSSHGQSRKNRLESCETESISQIDVENGKIVGRTDSRRSTFLGLVFGKKPSKEEDEGNENMPRLNSLERAEIAADLLETKWSTNLPITSLNFGKAQKVDDEAGTSEEPHKEEIASPSVGKGDVVMSDNVLGEHFGESTVEFPPSIRAHGEVVEVYSSENGDIVNRHEVFSDILSEIDASKLETTFEDSTMITEHIVDIQSSEFARVSNGNNGSSDELGNSLSAEENAEESGGRENASYIFYETIQSSTVRIDVADSGLVLPTASSDRSDEMKHNGEVVIESIEYVSKFEPILPQEASSNVDDSTKCSSCENPEIPGESSVVVGAPDRESPLEGMKNENEEEYGVGKLEDAKSDILEDKLQPEERQSDICSPDIVESDSSPISSPENSKESKDFPISTTIEGGNEESKVAGGVETDAFFYLGEDRVTRGHGPHASSTFDDVATPRSLLLSASEDEHTLFSDVDNYAPGEFSSQFPIEEEGDSEEHLFLEPEEHSEGHMSQDIIEDDSLNDLHEASITPTTSICIPTKRNSSEESDRLVRSLPNVPSQIHHLDMSENCHPLSSSVQLNSQKFDPGDSGDGSPVSAKLEEGSSSEKVQIEPPSEHAAEESNGYDAAVGKKDKPTVEISLCRHLLLEGMGAEAASKAFDSEKVDFEKFVALGPSIVKNNRLVVRIGGRYFSWNVAAPIILGLVSFDKDQIFESESIRVEKPTAIVPSGGPWGIWPFRFTKSRSMKSEQDTGETKDKIAINPTVDGSPAGNDKSRPKRTKKRVRLITPSPEQLASLKLNDGRNSVTFSFESAMLGKQQVDARIYLWKWNTRIVVSDVDGTITKSDVLGQFMPLVGKDWSQTGVAHLFSSIKDNGYEFIFLSARAIAQAYITRQFLFNLKQDGKSLPDGPVVISPDGLFPSLYREVIRRAPHEFKISCLEEIRALFPPESNPFYAGFGNRHTDEISYLKVGIPKGKIFIINPRGQVAVNHLVDTRSYTSLNALVNGMFPPTTSAEQEEFNAWNYWRLPLPDIDG